jgi:hypothetical protein
MRGFGLRGGLNREFVIFALRLRDGGGNVVGFAGRGDQIDSSVSKGFEIFVPVREARGDDDGHSAIKRVGDGEQITVGAVGEAALAENQADILFREQIAALAETRGVQRSPAVLLEYGGERVAMILIRGHDENLWTSIHEVFPQANGAK